ncbi:hypothetical protein B0J13DRAFT_125311 [Dactylonectria estremocensis]|uniref:Uncharacterized protein n=1 Tax=Dactylonectria estremocensis TaxID=1079267 RepID=A0A9P9FEZ2_9HYPO|nr:hypothetical protein B0J13DRAFT_125311 [Dactylonectria estremocensis]
MSFGVAAIALALFSVIGLGYIHRRANRSTRPSGSERRRRSPLQRAIRRVLAKWTGEYDEEKQAMLRHRSDSDDSVTMEQEIARFREAAFMVEGLVAAEEGRTHRGMVHQAPHHLHQYHHPHPHGPPPHGPPPPPHGPPHGLPPHGPPPHGPPPHGPPPHGPPPPPRPPMIPEDAAPTEYPDFVTGNERLPSYDDETHDASVVSDGCRYMPGSADYSPSTTASTTSDLLGDSKH